MPLTLSAGATPDQVVPAYVAGTTPYPWPYNGDLAVAATAVVVVTPSAGPNASDDAVLSTRVERALAVIESVRQAGGTVIHSTTTPPAHAADLSGDPASLFCGVAFDETVRSQGVDGFYGSALESILRRRRLERLVLVGIGLETCVHSTMRSANDRGYECLLVVDACAAYDAELVGPAVSMIEMSGGIFGAVGTSDAVRAAFGRSRAVQ